MLGADTLFRAGDVASLRARALPSAGAIAVRRWPGRLRSAIRDGLVERVVDPDGPGPFSGAPLWAVGAPVHERLCLDNRPWELAIAFQACDRRGRADCGGSRSARRAT